MTTDEQLTRKEELLIAVGVSIAAGCRPCTAFNIKAIRHSGATDDEINQAVSDALCVRENATKIMTGLAEKYLGKRNVTKEAGYGDSATSLINELVSIGAAFAINCTTSLEAHIKEARKTGASDLKILAALRVARNIKKIAEEKSEAVLKDNIQPVTSHEATAPKDCGSTCSC